MKKVKVFFSAAALLLITATVFAGRTKFADVGIYAISGSTQAELATSFTSDLTISKAGSQVKIDDSNSNPYNVYTYDNVADQFVPLYSSSAW